MKKLVSRSERIYSQYETVDPNDLIKRRDALAAKLPAELAKLIIFEIDTETYAYDPNEYHGLYMKWQDHETDAEYKKRTKQEAERKEAQDKRDRAEFERLSKKFK